MVPFYGDSIEVARDTRDGSFHVSIRRVCENLGIGFSSQLEKLKGYHWARVSMIDTRDQLGRQQELAFLPLTQVPAWLTHINPDKIGGGPEQIEKLKQYQVEAVDVLYKHFVGPQQAVPAQDPIVALAQSVMASAKLALEMRQTQLALAGEVGEIRADQHATQQQVDDLVELRTASLRVMNDIPRSDQPVAPLTDRAKVRILVNTYVKASGSKYADVWNRLYNEFYYRYNFDALGRARRSGKRPIDVIEQAGRMEELYKVVSALCARAVSRQQPQTTTREILNMCTDEPKREDCSHDEQQEGLQAPLYANQSDLSDSSR